MSPRAKDRPTADELAQILSGAGVPAPTPGWFAAGVTGPTVPVHVPPPRLLTRRRLLITGGVIGAAAAASALAAVIVEPAFRWPTRARAATDCRARILWQLRSGAAPVAAPPGQVPAGQRILVDAARVVTALGSDVVATRPDGGADWRTALSAERVTLRRWGDGVLVNDARRLWLLDAATGTQRFLATVVDDEERLLDASGIAAGAEIGDIAVAPDRAFLSLGSATIAVDRPGSVVWRDAAPATPRPRGPPAGADP